jgi:hypothetical protein
VCISLYLDFIYSCVHSFIHSLSLYIMPGAEKQLISAIWNLQTKLGMHMCVCVFTNVCIYIYIYIYIYINKTWYFWSEVSAYYSYWYYKSGPSLTSKALACVRFIFITLWPDRSGKDLSCNITLQMSYLRLGMFILLLQD